MDNLTFSECTFNGESLLEPKSRAPGLLEKGKRILRYIRNIRLQAATALKSTSNQKIIQSIVVTILAGISVIWAAQMSEQNSITRWIQSHHPTSDLQSAVLLSYGCKKISDPKTLAKIERSLPMTIQAVQEWWWSAHQGQLVEVGPNGIAAFQIGESQLPIKGLGPLNNQELAWSTLGSGWPGLESLVEKLSNLPKQKPTEITKKSAKKGFKDPKFISY